MRVTQSAVRPAEMIAHRAAARRYDITFVIYKRDAINLRTIIIKIYAPRIICKLERILYKNGFHGEESFKQALQALITKSQFPLSIEIDGFLFEKR